MSLHCLVVICFLLLQCDVQGRYVLTWSNAVCSCGNDVSVLLFNGHVLGVVQSRTPGAVCSKEQYPSSHQPCKRCRTPLCTRRWQPCPVFHTVPITTPSLVYPVSSAIKDPSCTSPCCRVGAFTEQVVSVSQPPGAIKRTSVVIRPDASQESNCQTVTLVAACRDMQGNLQ